VQVGVRDFGEREHAFAQESRGRIRTLFDADLATRQVDGGTCASSARSARRPAGKVYVSFDVDGLDPTLCPSTGTPVPGGLSWARPCCGSRSCRSGSEVVGLDLNEVNPGEARRPRTAGTRSSARGCSTV
jgi:agmatinase